MKKIVIVILILLIAFMGFGTTVMAENDLDIDVDDPYVPEYSVITRSINKNITASKSYPAIGTTIYIVYNVSGTIDLRDDTNEIVSYSLSYSLVNKWYTMPSTNYGNLDVTGFGASSSGGVLTTKVYFELITFNPNFYEQNGCLSSVAASY